MNIGVIGGGSIGLLLSGYLSMKGHDITIYVRRVEQKEKLNNSGLTIINKEERNTCVTSKLLDEYKHEDILFVCVKQYQLPQIISVLKHATCPVVFLQNGLGHIEYIVEEASEQQDIMVATTDHGAFRVCDNTVKHTGLGKINISLVRGNENSYRLLITDLSSYIFPFYDEPNWYTMLSKKLIINAVVNPITAIFQVENGHLQSNPYLKKIARELFDEAVDVLGLQNEEEWQRVLSVINQTKENFSSMLVDIKEKRPTEVEGILGYLISKSSRDVPALLFAYNSIKALEFRNDNR